MARERSTGDGMGNGQGVGQVMIRKRLCVVVAAEITVTSFLLGHLRALAERYDLTLVVNTRDPALLGRHGIRGDTVPVAIQRDIDPLRDAAALAALTRLFRACRFDAVHSYTPKAGLLAMLAARIARVPVRTHTFTGQVWATRTGAARAVLKTADRLTAAAATTVLADSLSQCDFLVSEGVVRKGRVGTLGAGSISGVDLERFKPDAESRRAIRAEHGIPPAATVFLFVGRLKRDKGILDLARAFSLHSARHPGSVLLVVGPDEEGLSGEVERMAGAGRVILVPFTPYPERYMAAADVLCLPSHREGFGVVVIEAAAAGLPALASRIYGVTDAVLEGTTGLLHAPGAVEEIAAALDHLVKDPEQRRTLGERARRRAGSEFSKERVTGELVTLYGKLLG